MFIRPILLLINIILINIAFILSFLIRLGFPFPEYNFSAYKNSAFFLTLIYILSLSFFGVFKKRFNSSWELFRQIFWGLFFGTLFSITFVYVFRTRLGAFPTGVFFLFFIISLLLIFSTMRIILKANKKIRKNVLIIGEGQIDPIVTMNAEVKRCSIDDIEKHIKTGDVDEIIISDMIDNKEDMSLLIYFIQKLKIDIIFSPSNYMKLLSDRINGKDSYSFLDTFVGRKTYIEEFLIRSLDIIGSIIILLSCTPLIIIIYPLIKITSSGSSLYKQNRVGKHGKTFTLYKFRTMVKDAEKQLGPVMASQDDPRVTKVGKILRRTRLDELPQLFNVLKGDMSLVGPRPERPHFVKIHKALRELRLAVRPGMTGLAQIRSYYDLKPQHKIKYDYLYIQRKSFLLNLYILVKTIPVILKGKGR